MAKTFVDELIAINKRIPRRLMSNGKDDLVTAIGNIVTPKYVGVKLLTIYDPLDPLKRTEGKPFFSQLGRGNYRGAMHIDYNQAQFALGNDFHLSDGDYCKIQAMLEACESDLANAYFLGDLILSQDCIRVPAAYFNIPEDVHKSLAIDRKSTEFSGLIKLLRAEEKVNVRV